MGGGVNLREGRAAVSKTGLGRGHETCPCASQGAWHQGPAVPPPGFPPGVSPKAPLGGWRLCPAM